MLTTLPEAEFSALEQRTAAEYAAFRARGLKLDMTRGKPSPEQLDLAEGMLALPGNRDHFAESGEDARNYGGLQGLPEARALFTGMLGAPAGRIVLGNNSSLALMHDCIAWAMLRGVPGGERPWSKEKDVAFLCPVPGYDRHFAICEAFGIRMIPVALGPAGPDMAQVESLVADPAVKGMWCVPQYSNPSGETYSDETVRALAVMKTGSPDFRLFWDNAYSVHDLGETPQRVANILDACEAAGHPDRAFVFASTSKITLAGAGLAALASSQANIGWFMKAAQIRTIGPDKLNQLRHVRFLKDAAGIAAHMAKHRALLAPKFAAVLDTLERRLGGTGAARWTKPEGGYFISVDVPDGTASRVVALAREAGLALTPAGATWPHGRDPHDRNLRLAPSYPSLADVRTAAEGIALCILTAAIEAERARRAGG
ncbi:aminotransferase class I/II-fold pyridoxal phosphate-dependent enzyme [Enterovirga sp.]|uniref:aminotransferase class I/II-fold pyridoxal phosphate-dependent enzyme n=1 Tax=Enterovirga sp. TaxID=2026350 RepID=UPI002D1809C0|nr:aminotransferase class I/II-fold pyridoxal phosphate-dependent enzyme [Enterovirga sp.]HMO31191.1 aminotransferase class I/II-fold pyridoxal phosphate-dependent enzyme [Enterovirga sp.]